MNILFYSDNLETIFLRKSLRNWTKYCINNITDCKLNKLLTNLENKLNLPFDKFIDLDNSDSYNIFFNDLERSNLDDFETINVMLVSVGITDIVKIFSLMHDAIMNKYIAPSDITITTDILGFLPIYELVCACNLYNIDIFF